MNINRMMDILERIVLGVLFDFGTKSNYFLIFLQALHFCYSKVFPDNLIELKFGGIAYCFILGKYDFRIPAFLTYFTLAKATKSLGSTESSLVASLASAIILNYDMIPITSIPILSQLFVFMVIFSLPNRSPFIIDCIFFIIISIVVFLDTNIQVLILDNINFIIYWFLVSVIGLIIIFTANYMKINQIIQRKLFHFLLLAIYIPGLSNPILTCFASLLALNLILVLEIIRPKYAFLNQFFLKFTDEKDSEDLIVTHIYLLLGFCFPILLSIILKNELLAWSGIISLGVGDTFACLIGYYYGQIHLPYRRKTIEGTLGGFLSMCIFCSYFELLTPYITLHLLLISLYEAYTQKIDNLVLPILTFSLFSLV